MAKAQVKTIICYQSFCSSPFKIYHRCNYSELMYSILKRTRCTMVTNQILLSLTLAIAAMFFLWKQTFMANGSNIVSLIRYNHGSLSSIKKSLSRCQGPTPIESRTFGVLVLPKKMYHVGFKYKIFVHPPKSRHPVALQTPNFTSHLKTSPFSTVQINHHGFSVSNFVSFCLGVVDSWKVRFKRYSKWEDVWPNKFSYIVAIYL